MTGEQFLLSADARRTVLAAVQAHCHIRDWRILALNVRTNHAHIVLTNVLTRPEIALGQIKAWSTRRLRDSGQVTASERVWTREGSTRHLFFEEAVRAAIRYVLDEQGPDIRMTVSERGALQNDGGDEP